ncbi:MAG: hypothetical protein HN390_05335 [Anaerolineae bacterium]|jgi:hypothetical protein|nr:hypothetical protein [Anaerolineae bacterium]MBT7190220.1 hypothetical protein [Anaerolineae bacterium]MBT7991378.1 hypothetical protein [Anaerolineae bacterium]
MSRWIQALLAAALGLVIGLFYGWRIAPVEYTDLAPNTLHADYRNDYILMVSESYQNDKDLELAAHRLALVSSASPVEIIEESLETSGYAQENVDKLEKLLSEMRAWQPSLSESMP